MCTRTRTLSTRLQHWWRKKLNSQFLSCSIYGICEGRGWLKTSYGGWGWLKTSEYSHIRRRGLKLLKNRRMIFERSLRGRPQKVELPSPCPFSSLSAQTSHKFRKIDVFLHQKVRTSTSEETPLSSDCWRILWTAPNALLICFSYALYFFAILCIIDKYNNFFQFWYWFLHRIRTLQKIKIQKIWWWRIILVVKRWELRSKPPWLRHLAV